MKHLITSPQEIRNFNPSSSLAFSSSNNKPLTSFAFNKQSLLRRDISFNSIDDQTKNDINEINKIFETTQKSKFSNAIKQDQLELIKNKLRSLEPKKLSQLITSAMLSGNDFAEHLKIMNQLRDDIIAIGSNVTEKKAQFEISQAISFNPQTTPSINPSKVISLDDLTNIINSFCQSPNEVELYNFFNKTLFQSNKDVELIFSNSSIAKENLEVFKNSIAELELKLTEQLKNKSSILSDIDKSKINEEILQLKKISKALLEKKDVCIDNPKKPSEADSSGNKSSSGSIDPAISLPVFIITLFLCFISLEAIRRRIDNRQQANLAEANSAAVIQGEANSAAVIPVAVIQGEANPALAIPAAAIPAEDTEISPQQQVEMIAQVFARATIDEFSQENLPRTSLLERFAMIHDIIRRNSAAQYINGEATWHGTSPRNSRSSTQPQENGQERQPPPSLGNSRNSARLQGNSDLQRQASQPRTDNSR